MKKAFIIIVIITVVVVVIFYLSKPRITVLSINPSTRMAVLRINGKTREFQYDKEAIGLGRMYSSYSIVGSADPTGLHWIRLLKDGSIVATLADVRV